MEMKIVSVDHSNMDMALEVYIASWRASHQHICTPEFLRNRDYAGYLRKKMDCLYMIWDGFPAGVFCLEGETFGDLYIHPNHQSKGYGTACIKFAAEKSAMLRLTVLSNNAGAIRLYEKIGFRFTGNDIQLKNDLFEREMILNEIAR